MACAACERRRQMMKHAMAKGMAHAARLAGLRRGGKTDAEATADVQASEGDNADAQAEGSGQAADAGTAHRDEGMATAKGSRAGKGRVSVPRVSKGRGGKEGAR